MTVLITAGLKMQFFFLLVYVHGNIFDIFHSPREKSLFSTLCKLSHLLSFDVFPRRAPLQYLLSTWRIFIFYTTTPLLVYFFSCLFLCNKKFRKRGKHVTSRWHETFVCHHLEWSQNMPTEKMTTKNKLWFCEKSREVPWKHWEDLKETLTFEMRLASR